MRAVRQRRQPRPAPLATLAREHDRVVAELDAPLPAVHLDPAAPPPGLPRRLPQTMCRPRPIPPSRTRLVVSDRMGAWCQLCTVCSTRPAEAAASVTRRRSPGELTSG